MAGDFCEIGSIPLSNETWAPIVQMVAVFQRSYGQIHPFVATMLCAVGTIMNFITVVVLTRPTMLSPVNVLLCAVAICDILVMTSTLIFVVHFHFVADSRCEVSDYSYGWAIFTIVHAHVSVIFHATSIWLTVSLAQIRVLTIRRATSGPTTSITERFSIVLAIVTFIVMTAVNLPNFLTFEVDEVPAEMYLSCMQTDSDENVFSAMSNGSWAYAVRAHEKDCMKLKMAFWSNGMIFKVVPCLLLTVSIVALLKIIADVSNKRKNLAQVMKKKVPKDHTTPMLVAVLSIFLLAELPQGIFLVMSGIFSSEVFKKKGFVQSHKLWIDKRCLDLSSTRRFHGLFVVAQFGNRIPHLRGDVAEVSFRFLPTLLFTSTLLTVLSITNLEITAFVCSFCCCARIVSFGSNSRSVNRLTLQFVSQSNSLDFCCQLRHKFESFALKRKLHAQPFEFSGFPFELRLRFCELIHPGDSDWSAAEPELSETLQLLDAQLGEGAKKGSPQQSLLARFYGCGIDCIFTFCHCFCTARARRVRRNQRKLSMHHSQRGKRTPLNVNKRSASTRQRSIPLIVAAATGTSVTELTRKSLSNVFNSSIAPPSIIGPSAFFAKPRKQRALANRTMSLAPTSSTRRLQFGSPPPRSPRHSFGSNAIRPWHNTARHSLIPVVDSPRRLSPSSLCPPFEFQSPTNLSPISAAQLRPNPRDDQLLFNGHPASCRFSTRDENENCGVICRQHGKFDVPSTRRNVSVEEDPMAIRFSSPPLRHSVSDSNNETRTTTETNLKRRKMRERAATIGAQPSSDSSTSSLDSDDEIPTICSQQSLRNAPYRGSFYKIPQLTNEATKTRTRNWTPKQMHISQPEDIDTAMLDGRMRLVDYVQAIRARSIRSSARPPPQTACSSMSTLGTDPCGVSSFVVGGEMSGLFGGEIEREASTFSDYYERLCGRRESRFTATTTAIEVDGPTRTDQGISLLSPRNADQTSQLKRSQPLSPNLLTVPMETLDAKRLSLFSNITSADPTSTQCSHAPLVAVPSSFRHSKRSTQQFNSQRHYWNESVNGVFTRFGSWWSERRIVTATRPRASHPFSSLWRLIRDRASTWNSNSTHREPNETPQTPRTRVGQLRAETSFPGVIY
ncbi:Cholecystokinin receptor [Aphelenchoides besseyi]|nr:Cholecystokinin receptor [Aphelenchoides besseyi]